MAKTKLAHDAFLKNAEKRIKKSVKEGETAYATSDGQVFDKADTKEGRLIHAQNYAFKFAPPLEIKEVKGEKKLKTSNTK